jgi:hypothetical protein
MLGFGTRTLRRGADQEVIATDVDARECSRITLSPTNFERNSSLTKKEFASRLGRGLKYRTGVSTGYASHIGSGHDARRQTFG